MFCSQCGKKVRENMLFCPFCGAEIIVPDQDGEDDLPAVPERPAKEPKSEPESEAREADGRLFVDEAEGDSEEGEEDAYRPTWRAEEPDWLQSEPEEPELAPEPPREPPKPDPAEKPGMRDVRAASVRHFGRDSGPVQEDLFLDNALAEPEDDYDEYDDDGDEAAEEVTRFEDEDRPGFLMRHLRSVVGLLLFALLAVIVGMYALSGPGQENLAKLNLASRPEVYSRLGKRSYDSGQYAQAGLYYERALSRSPGNYGYASSAAKCYIDGQMTDKAAEMLKQCIAIQPDSVDPYIYLLGLYPDGMSRPLEVTQLIQQGYARTGNARLKIKEDAS